MITDEASTIPDDTEPANAPSQSKWQAAEDFALGTYGVVRRAAREVWVWFGSFRRTRPFWGGLWMLLGGLWMFRLSQVGVQVAVHGGLSAAGGYMAGGGLIVCGAIVWAAPSQRYVAGLIGVLLGVASLVISNLGGFFLGMTLGVLGGAMAFSWGPKKRKKPRRKVQSRAAAAAASRSAGADA